MIAQATATIDPRTIEANEPETHRWPIPHAAMFIFTSASVCWIGIFAVTRFLFM